MTGLVDEPASLHARRLERRRTVLVLLLRVGAQLRGVDLGGPAQLAGGGLRVGEHARRFELG
jgi:hypothetical protein